jgi:hypothetical protein
LKEFVSRQWTSILVLVAAMSVICVILVPYGFAWPGLAWASLALATAGLLALRPAHSIRQVIHSVDTESGPAIATPERVAMPIGEARLVVEGEATP